MPLIRAALGALLAAALVASAAGVRAKEPRHLLLAEARNSLGQPKAPQFFTEDAVHQANMPDHSVVPQNKSCHPTCSWACEKQECQNKCKPVCQPPKCVTACQKPILSACQQVCEDPNCVVVCPQQCSTGQCPECTTVCDTANCHLDCGQARKCETKCADPLCTYECTPETDPEACPPPDCRMQCDTPSCTGFSKQDQPTLREEYDGKNADPAEMKVQDSLLLGKDLAWSGLAKIKAEDMEKFKTPLAPVGAGAMGGSLPVEGATPMGGALCPGCGDKVDCACQDQDAEVKKDQVQWVRRDGPTPHPYAKFKK